MKWLICIGLCSPCFAQPASKTIFVPRRIERWKVLVRKKPRSQVVVEYLKTKKPAAKGLKNILFSVSLWVGEKRVLPTYVR
jgi:hypothetical protein